MNPAADISMRAITIQGDKRFLLGVGVSLALHLMLLFAYRGARPSLPAPQAEPPSSIAVRIVPPPPPPAPRIEAPATPRTDAARTRTARPAPPKSVIAVPAPPQEDASPAPFVVQQADKPDPAPADAPTFDMNAARKTARQLASQTKLGREGTAVAQFPDPPLETESKFAKAISKAKRRNCKDGIPGGLLAPLFLALDKKDSGCKW